MSIRNNQFLGDPAISSYFPFWIKVSNLIATQAQSGGPLVALPRTAIAMISANPNRLSIDYQTSNTMSII